MSKSRCDTCGPCNQYKLVCTYYGELMCEECQNIADKFVHFCNRNKYAYTLIEVQNFVRAKLKAIEELKEKELNETPVQTFTRLLTNKKWYR